MFCSLGKDPIRKVIGCIYMKWSLEVGLYIQPKKPVIEGEQRPLGSSIQRWDANKEYGRV